MAFAGEIVTEMLQIVDAEAVVRAQMALGLGALAAVRAANTASLGASAVIGDAGLGAILRQGQPSEAPRTATGVSGHRIARPTSASRTVH